MARTTDKERAERREAAVKTQVDLERGVMEKPYPQGCMRSNVMESIGYKPAHHPRWWGSDSHEAAVKAERLSRDLNAEKSIRAAVPALMNIRGLMEQEVLTRLLDPERRMLIPTKTLLESIPKFVKTIAELQGAIPEESTKFAFKMLQESMTRLPPDRRQEILGQIADGFRRRMSVLEGEVVGKSGNPPNGGG